MCRYVSNFFGFGAPPRPRMAYEGRQAAEAAPVSRGTAVPLAPTKHVLPHKQCVDYFLLKTRSNACTGKKQPATFIPPPPTIVLRMYCTVTNGHLAILNPPPTECPLQGTASSGVPKGQGQQG